MNELIRADFIIICLTVFGITGILIDFVNLNVSEINPRVDTNNNNKNKNNNNRNRYFYTALRKIIIIM